MVSNAENVSIWWRHHERARQNVQKLLIGERKHTHHHAEKCPKLDCQIKPALIYCQPWRVAAKTGELTPFDTSNLSSVIVIQDTRGPSQYKDAVLPVLKFPLQRPYYLYSGELHTYKDGLYIETWPCLQSIEATFGIYPSSAWWHLNKEFLSALLALYEGNLHGL